MANWKPLRLSDVINDIKENKFVLPVIQRRLVWTEEKMEILFDTLLKGASFGSIVVIEEEKDSEPLFSFRSFTLDGNPIRSNMVKKLDQMQYFVIDGQQRLQSFYIGLEGSINNKKLYFDLFSDYDEEFAFKFSDKQDSLPDSSEYRGGRISKKCLWYPVKALFTELKRKNDDRKIAKDIISKFNISDDKEKDAIEMNVHAFHVHVIAGHVIGLSVVTLDKEKEESFNKQKIVELFRRLNDGGTRLTGFDLVASILKGFDADMESFLDSTLADFSDISLTQENLVKTIFILQDEPSKEMGNITAKDAAFAIEHKKRITSCLKGLRRFLQASRLDHFYEGDKQSFVPLFFIIYHLFHKNITNEKVESYFDNYDTGNIDFPLIKKWIYLSLINGLFRSRGAGWVPYKTGIKNLFYIISKNKNNTFPYEDIIKMYSDRGLKFTQTIEENNIDNLDSVFFYYLIYDRMQSIRDEDIDHIHPKSRLEGSYPEDKIWNIRNYQLIDAKTNRVEKRSNSFAEWVKTKITDKGNYVKKHIIPEDETLWEEKNYLSFLDKRGALLVKKINENIL